MFLFLSTAASCYYSKALRAWRNMEGSDVLLIDGDNVRGKSSWDWSAAELAAEAASVSRRHAALRTVLFLDHGEQREAFAPPESSRFVLAFAGPRSSADDAIVDSVEWFLSGSNASVAVATSDYGLRERLTALAARERRGGRSRRLRYVTSHSVVDVMADSKAQREESYVLPEYVDAFERARDRVATHAAKNRKKTVFGEQTWMRVVLAERLRLVARDGVIDDPLLVEFADEYSAAAAARDVDFKPNNMLAHRLSDQRQRLDLVRFADALRGGSAPGPPIDQILERPRPVVALRPPSRRARRRRKGAGALLKKGGLRVVNIDAPRLKAAFANHRDDLEAAMADWLRADVPSSSDPLPPPPPM